MRPLSVIGAPTSVGAYAPGQEKAPAAFRRRGLIEALARRPVVDRGDGPHFRWWPDQARPQAMNCAAVAASARAVAEQVAAAMEAGEDVLVLGGDCTVELGTVAGALRGCDDVGLVYIDYDVDLNVPATSDGALDWTGVAHLLGLPGADETLTNLGPRAPMLKDDALLYYGADNISPAEAETLSARRIAHISGQDVRGDSVGMSESAVRWASRFERVLIHFDVDVLSFTDFPIAENVRRCLGLSLDQAFMAVQQLCALPNFRGLTITEVNPDHAPDEAAAFGELIARLRAALT